jgi:cyclin-A
VSSLLLQAFLQRYLRAAHVATTLEYQCLEAFSRYILELSLLDFSMLRYRSSVVAAASILLARTLLAHQHTDHSSSELRAHMVWTRTMEYYTCHPAKDLEECVRQLHRTLLSVNSGKSKRQPFVCHKYSQAKWGAVATMHVMPALPSTMFDRFAMFSVPAHYLAHVKP